MQISLPLIHLDDLVFTPLPQLQLKVQLVDQGICAPEDISITEFSRLSDVQASFAAICAERPRIVGFSCYVWNFLVVERISRALKSFYGDECLIVWGGPHVSEIPASFIERYPSSVDLVVSWYGEVPFTEIVKGVKANKNPDEIARDTPGVWSAGHTGEKPKEFPPFEQFPFPYRPEYFPDTLREKIGERVFLVETFRNCPFSCSYCLWGQAAKKLDALPAKRVLEELYFLMDQGARHFKFADAGLGLKRARDKEIFRELAQCGLDQGKVHLRTYFFWQTLDEEWCEIFKSLIDQGALGQMDMGVQTFNTAALSDLRRATDYQKFENAIEMLQKFEIPYSIDLILGLPGDNLAGFKHSVREVLRYKPARFQSFLCSILPGTFYDTNRERLGIKTIQGSMLDDDEMVVSTETFSAGEMQEALDLESWLFICFSMQLCSHSIRKLSEEGDRDLLSIVEALQEWAPAHAPHLTSVMRAYRDTLYAGRQQGRVNMERELFSKFTAVYQEFLEFFVQQGASSKTLDLFRDELLKFPKTREVAITLDGIDGIQVTSGGEELSRRQSNGESWSYLAPEEEPILGVIGTKYAYWVWKRQLTDGDELR